MPTSPRRVLAAAKDAWDRHRERHRPSGFGFAIADRVAWLDPVTWDALTANGTLFLQRPYLSLLEANAPANLRPRCALVFRGETPVAAVAAQLLRITAEAPDAAGLGAIARRVGAAAINKARIDALVCGNLLSWGRHGVAFAAGEDPRALWPGVAEALYRIRRAERLTGQSDFVMVKDFPADQHDVEALRRYSYRSLATDPDMVLELKATWRTYDDYLAGLNKKYRKAARQLIAEVDAAGLRVEPLVDLAPEAERLHALHRQVFRRASVRLASAPAGYLPALARLLGPERFRCTVIRRGDEILGFVTALKDGENGFGYLIGFDYGENERAPIYLRLLHGVVADAINLGCRRLSLGRTALEPKARLGAAPVPQSVWLRHRVPAINLLVRSLLGVVPHDEAPERSPFKDAPVT